MERADECKCSASFIFCSFSGRTKMSETGLNPLRNRYLSQKPEMFWNVTQVNYPQHTLTESCRFSLTYWINSDSKLDCHRLEKQNLLKKKLGGQTSSSSEPMKCPSLILADVRCWLPKIFLPQISKCYAFALAAATPQRTSCCLAFL